MDPVLIDAPAIRALDLRPLDIWSDQPLETLQQRFDRLFSIGGEKRLISEQDQWIAPNRLRVIWR